MTKLTVHETAEAEAATPQSASQELIRQALKEAVVEDEKGRKITLRKPGVLAQYRILEAVGPETAANQTYMQMVNPLIWVVDIDGEPVLFPQSKKEVEALILRLDDDGLAAVMSWYMANVIGPTMDAMKAAERAAEEAAKVKN